MKCCFEEVIWKVKYALELRKLLGLSFLGAYRNAGCMLECIDYDLEECPKEMAYEEYTCWRE